MEELPDNLARRPFAAEELDALAPSRDSESLVVVSRCERVVARPDVSENTEMAAVVKDRQGFIFPR